QRHRALIASAAVLVMGTINDHLGTPLLAAGADIRYSAWRNPWDDETMARLRAAEADPGPLDGLAKARCPDEVIGSTGHLARACQARAQWRWLPAYRSCAVAVPRSGTGSGSADGGCGPVWVCYPTWTRWRCVPRRSVRQVRLD